MKQPLITALLLCSAIVISPTSHAQTADWTPYVKDMMNSCNTKKLMEMSYDMKYNNNGKIINWGKLPKTLKSSIEKSDGYGNFYLKNATVFGQPLTQIYTSEESDGDSTILTFANDGFISLLPKFTLSDGKRTYKAGTKHYWVNEIILTKQKSNHLYQNYHHEILLNSYTLNDYKNADKELISMFVNEQNKRTDYYDDTLNENISKSFYKEQNKLLNQLLKTHAAYQKQFEHTNNKTINKGTGYLKNHIIKTYKTHATGYQIHDTEIVTTLVFNKAERTIGCNSRTW